MLINSISPHPRTSLSATSEVWHWTVMATVLYVGGGGAGGGPHPGLNFHFQYY